MMSGVKTNIRSSGWGELLPSELGDAYYGIFAKGELMADQERD